MRRWRNSTTRRSQSKAKRKKSITQRIISERMRARGPGDWFPGGCRAEPCWECEGKALTSEAKPSEQYAPGHKKRSGEYERIPPPKAIRTRTREKTRRIPLEKQDCNSPNLNVSYNPVLPGCLDTIPHKRYISPFAL